MRNTVDILKVPFDSITMDKAVAQVLSFVSDGRVHTVYTPNAEIVIEAKTNPHLMEVLRKGDLLIADGAGIILASKILGCHLPEKVSGIDLSKRLFTSCANQPLSFFFFGSKPGVAEMAAQKVISQYPGVKIAGCRNGYFNKDEEEGIIKQINDSGADILLAALGAPKQEFWIHQNKNRLKAGVCMGVGGSLDIFAGQLPAAPEVMRRNGLEWLYRLYREPWRYKRMMKLPKFVLTVVGVKLGLVK
jgi:N-acetylglucosaminyldiphosphoundecaprenol N-acetyl-beta-D-mannosaminyltransferase